MKRILNWSDYILDRHNIDNNRNQLQQQQQHNKMNYLSTAMAGVRVGLSSTSGARLALPFSSPLSGVGRIASVEVGAVRHMAVPKKKVSVQKRRVRRFHNKFNGVRSTICLCVEARLTVVTYEIIVGSPGLDRT